MIIKAYILQIDRAKNKTTSTMPLTLYHLFTKVHIFNKNWKKHWQCPWRCLCWIDV